MRFFKWLGIIVAVLAVALWFALSFAAKKGAEMVFADLVQSGNVATAPGLSFASFPTRLGLAMTDLHFQNEQTGERWDLPHLTISAPSWKPWHVTAELPATQSFTLPYQGVMQTVTLASDGLAGAVRVSPDVRAALQEITAGGAALQMTSDLGWTVSAKDLRLRLLINSEDPKAYTLTLVAAEIAPDASLARALAAVSLPDIPASDLPATVESISMVMQLRFTQTLDLTGAIDPRLASLDLQELTAIWGPLKITAAGTLAGDAAGFASGRIEVAVTNWDRLPPLLAATGAVQPGVVTLVSNGMRALAAESGDPALLQVPLVMQDGRVSFGPFPLGEAPRMARGAGG